MEMAVVVDAGMLVVMMVSSVLSVEQNVLILVSDLHLLIYPVHYYPLCIVATCVV